MSVIRAAKAAAAKERWSLAAGGNIVARKGRDAIATGALPSLALGFDRAPGQGELRPRS